MKNPALSVVLSLVSFAAVAAPATACGPSENQSSCHTRYVYIPRVAVLKQHAPERHVAQKPAAMEVEAGASYRMAGGEYGLNLGSIVLQVGDVEIECDVLTWSNNEVTFQVPPLKLKRVTAGSLNIVSASGRRITSKSIHLKGVVVQRVTPSEAAPPAEIFEPLTTSEPQSFEVPPSPQSFDLGEGLE